MTDDSFDLTPEGEGLSDFSSALSELNAGQPGGVDATMRTRDGAVIRVANRNGPRATLLTVTTEDGMVTVKLSMTDLDVIRKLLLAVDMDF